MSLTGRASLFRHHAVKSCDSTNALCLDAFEKGDPGNLWITADEQTSGKASRGRKWVSRRGNLYASLLLNDPCDVRHFTEIAFVAALAVRNVIAKSITDKEVLLKWPNDVLLCRRKCSGILPESRFCVSGNCVVIGIGINCQHSPQDVMFPATDIASEGGNVDLERIFALLAEQMTVYLEIWNRGEGFAIIRNLWLSHAWGLNEQTCIRLRNGDEVSGMFCGIDAFGHMEITDNSGKIIKVMVGDVLPVAGQINPTA